MIGLGTYAFFWQHSARAPERLSLRAALEATRDLDVGLFQICDYAPLDRMSDRELRETARVARELGVAIELGTKGVAPDHLERFARIAELFEARLVRSMVHAPGSRPSPAEAEAWLRTALPAYRAAGLVLALETYEQVATRQLVALIERIDSPALGICLDPANVVARLESPTDCVEATAAHVKSVHVKDFAFARQEGWVGFTYSGSPLGDGLHDYEHLLRVVRPRERGINEIVEHWLPWQGDPDTTIRAERAWTRRALDYLRSTS